MPIPQKKVVIRTLTCCNTPLLFCLFSSAPSPILAPCCGNSSKRHTFDIALTPTIYGSLEVLQNPKKKKTKEVETSSRRHSFDAFRGLVGLFQTFLTRWAGRPRKTLLRLSQGFSPQGLETPVYGRWYRNHCTINVLFAGPWIYDRGETEADRQIDRWLDKYTYRYVAFGPQNMHFSHLMYNSSHQTLESSFQGYIIEGSFVSLQRHSVVCCNLKYKM